MCSSQEDRPNDHSRVSQIEEVKIVQSDPINEVVSVVWVVYISSSRIALTLSLSVVIDGALQGDGE